MYDCTIVLACDRREGEFQQEVVMRCKLAVLVERMRLILDQAEDVLREGFYE